MQLLGIDFSCPIVQTIIVSVIVGILTLISILSLYLTLSCRIFYSRIKMEGKTVIITGANGGIGKETTRDIAKRGARIIMACRNLETAKTVRDEIVKETGNENIIIKKLDLGSQKSVREFAADILKTEQKLHVLIHNAGMALSLRRYQSVDGIELTMATNHYGPFLLTHLLIDLMKKSGPSRIVVVASELYRLASVNLDNLNPIGTLPAVYLYYVSKYANILFTRELARRLEGTNITANCLHPGIIDTAIWTLPFPMNYPMMAIAKGFFKTKVQGAQTTIYAAVTEELEGVSGKYFSDCKESELNAGASDMEKAKKLWEASYKMVNLTEKDPKI